MKEFSSILTTDSSTFRARVCLFFLKKKMFKDLIIFVGILFIWYRMVFSIVLNL